MSVALLPTLLLGTAFALQPPGAFHGDEPVARHGEQWLALRRDGREAALVGARLTVTPVFDAVLDSPGGASGRAVASDAGGEQIIAFLRGPGLRSGRVLARTVQVFRQRHRVLRPFERAATGPPRRGPQEALSDCRKPGLRAQPGPAISTAPIGPLAATLMNLPLGSVYSFSVLLRRKLYNQYRIFTQ